VPFSDADLIARVILNDDHNAFGELVRRYQSPMRAFLTRMTRGDSHLADDLAQETFLRAWKNLASFRGESRFATWLFGIAVNEYRAALRRRKELALEDLDELPADPEPASDSDTASARLDVNEALTRLTAPERAAIVLCCQNGLSHDEAARALGSPLGTVKTNVRRGKEKLRRWLEKSTSMLA
jgi:RNA polymerase sigma factor (sigma-70 family)